MEKVTYTQIDIALTGRKIHGVLFENGCKVRQLQEILKLSCPQPIYRWINGKALPSVDHLYMMHRIFCLHMEDFLIPKDVGKG